MSNQSQLDQLKKITKVVIDTGDIDSIKQYSPIDATTNPSLILKASKKAEYLHLVEEAVHFSRAKFTGRRDWLLDKLFVNFGAEILKHIPGRVSTEVDAHLSFDIQKSIERAKRLVHLYEEIGIERDRILIKLASTWEGFKAAYALEKEGIHCNMTLLFSLPQAIEAGNAGVTLISPFVGRILDWYKKNTKTESYPPELDPGVLSVRSIFNYYKYHKIPTVIMGASFRNTGEILELAGCDFLTIAPDLLLELQTNTNKVEKKLDASHVEAVEKVHYDESHFRWELNQNEMATEKLSEGIRNFAKDSSEMQDHLMKEYNL